MNSPLLRVTTVSGSPTAPRSRFNNIYAQQPPLGQRTQITGIKVDALCPVKLRCSTQSLFAVPWSAPGTLGIFDVTSRPAVIASDDTSSSSVAPSSSTVRYERGPPVLLAHGATRVIHDFCFSFVNERIVATSTRGDNLLRLWKVPQALDIATSVEIDSAELFLAGHERQVECIGFHPTVGGILASGAQDSSVRIWDIEGITDRLVLSVPSSSAAQSFSFDYGGDVMVVASTDAKLHLYDPRANSDPLFSVDTQLNPAKPIKTLWLTPDPLILTSGFSLTRHGSWEIGAIDVRKISSTGDTCRTQVEVSAASVGSVQTFWDPALPLVYVASRGEGVKVFEVARGSLSCVKTLKFDKQATQMDLLPKSVCSSTKCEIARFLRLLSDHIIETTSVYAPRRETAANDDLYPPVTCINTTATACDWFEKASIEPVMVETITSDSADKPTIPDIRTLPPLPSKLESMQTLTLISPSDTTLAATMKRSSKTLRRIPTIIANEGQPRASTASSSSRSSSTQPSLPVAETSVTINNPAKPEVFEGPAQVEVKTWFSRTWKPVHLKLYRTNLYVSATADSDPNAVFRLAQTGTKIEVLDEISFTLETAVQSSSMIKHRYMVASTTERDRWIEAFTRIGKVQIIARTSPTTSPVSSETQAVQKLESNHDGLSQLSPSNSAVAATLGIEVVSKSSAVSKESSNGSTSRKTSGEGIAALVGHLSVHSPKSLKYSTGAHWTPRFIVLDNDGMLHVYIDDKAFAASKAPIEILNISSAVAIRRLCIDSAESTTRHSPSTAFQISTPKRNITMLAKTEIEAENWVAQARNIVKTVSYSIETQELIDRDPIEGWVRNMSEKVQEPRWVWLSVLSGALFYTKDQFGDDIIDVRSLSHLLDVRSNDVSADSSQHSVEFQCFFEGGITVNHAALNTDARDNWIKEIQLARMESFNVLQRIGISSDHLQEEVHLMKNVDSEGDWIECEIGIHVINASKVAKGEEKCLIAVMGKAKISRICYVECNISSVKADAAYVLDTGNTIYYWHPDGASRITRAKAMDIASQIRKERSNRPTMQLVDDMPSFLHSIGPLDSSLHVKDLKSTTDSDFLKGVTRVYRIFDSPIAQRRVRLIYEGSLPSKSLLVEQTVVVVHCSTDIFLWIGRMASHEHKAIGAIVARGIARFMYNMDDGKSIFLQKVFQGRESPIFRENFIDYEGSLPISMRMAEVPKGHITSSLDQKPIDIASMISTKPIKEDQDESLLDDGTSGNSIIYLVKQFTKERISTKELCRAESYLIVYSFQKNGRETVICYFWQGRDSKITQKGTSAFLTVELTKETKCEVLQRRIVEGRETRHFCRIMGDLGVVIRLGAYKSEDKRLVILDCRIINGVRRAIEVESSGLLLCSNAAYLIIGNEQTFIWHGQFSEDVERDYAAALAKHFGCHPKIVADGESIEDLVAIGINKSHEVHDRQIGRTTPRLFLCSSGSGMVTVDEVVEFTVDDLDPNIVVLLDDGWNSLYVWFGVTAKSNEKLVGIETLVQYSNQLSTRKQKVFVTYCGHEPKSFTNIFQGWKPSRSPRVRPAEEVLAELKQETYPLDVLLCSDRLPQCLDVAKLETYLSDCDFEMVFKMTRQQFASLKAWEQIRLKKAVGF